MTAREDQLHEWKGAVDATGAVGQNLDKLITSAEKDQWRCRGGKVALSEQAKKLQSIHAYADKEFAEDKFDAETLSLVKRYVTRCIDATVNYAKQQEAEELASAGRVSAFREALGLAENHHKVAKARFDQLNTPLPEGDSDERKPRGGRKSAAERRAEADTADIKIPVKKKRAYKKRKATKKVS